MPEYKTPEFNMKVRDLSDDGRTRLLQIALCHTIESRNIELEGDCKGISCEKCILHSNNKDAFPAWYKDNML